MFYVSTLLDIPFVGLKTLSEILFRRCGNFAQCWDENMHFEHLSCLWQRGCKSKNFWLAGIADFKGWGGGGVRKRRRELLLQEPRLLHFAP